MSNLVIGHGEHGKDYLAQVIRDLTGMTFCSSSWAACEKAIYPFIGSDYPDIQACFDDRRVRRMEWRRLISDYNTPDKARLVKEVLAEHPMYVGLRCPLEFAASKDLFTAIYWVDASKRLPLDPSMNIEYDPACMIWIDNNGTKEQLKQAVENLFIK